MARLSAGRSRPSQVSTIENRRSRQSRIDALRAADRHLQRRAMKIHETLLVAFGAPTWRSPLPPIDELISTILSQNTNDINRDRGFTALRLRFPTWEEVRDA